PLKFPRTSRAVLPTWALAGRPFTAARALLTAWKRNWLSNMPMPTVEESKKVANNCGASKKALGATSAQSLKESIALFSILQPLLHFTTRKTACIIFRPLRQPLVARAESVLSADG